MRFAPTQHMQPCTAPLEEKKNANANATATANAKPTIQHIFSNQTLAVALLRQHDLGSGTCAGSFSPTYLETHARFLGRGREKTNRQHEKHALSHLSGGNIGRHGRGRGGGGADGGQGLLKRLQDALRRRLEAGQHAAAAVLPTQRSWRRRHDLGNRRREGCRCRVSAYASAGEPGPSCLQLALLVRGDGWRRAGYR